MKKLYSLILVTLVALSSSGQLKKFKVEIPNTPKFKISDSIQSFTILNRSLTPEYSGYNDEVVQTSFYKQNFRTNAVFLDSMASDTTIKVLADLLFQSERFDVVIPVDRDIYRLLPYTKVPEPLSWNYVESICDQFKTDALIVLENLAMRVVTNYSTQKEFVDYEYLKTYYASIDFYSRSHWRIYYPKTKKIILDYLMNEDTLFWDSYESDLKTTFRNLPTIKEAAAETGIKNALDFSKLITPKWSEETRYYYLLEDTNIDRSVQMAANGDWEGALDNWRQYADKGNSIKRSKILLNLALAAEMTGDIEQALEWVKQSQTLYYREVTNHYMKQLLLRKSKAKKKS
jgi:hypothetical protein